MNKNEFEFKYNQITPLYKDLSSVIFSDLSKLISEQNIAIFEIKHRVKEINSAFEKINRKSYENPFDEIEDFCGVRIICYYQSDVDLICKTIKDNYSVISSENTFDRLSSNEFGYRSTHLIIKIPDSWLGAPAYRKLNGLKADIQVRTLLMHAWAEIQHKLAYKNSEQVPDVFRRKIFRLSAKFEEADEQFEEIRQNIIQIKADASSGSESILDNLRKEPINLDTVTLMLEEVFPNRIISRSGVSELLIEISEIKISMSELIDMSLKDAKIVKDVERRFSECRAISDDYEFYDNPKDDYVVGEIDQEAVYTAVGCLRGAFDAFYPEYYSRNLNQTIGNAWHDENLFVKKLLGLI